LPGEAERRANSDPITGQAAWFDLCVRLEKCEPGEETSEPQFPTLPRLAGLTAPSAVNQYGAQLSHRRKAAK
jgi:sulfite dehydrogenase (quinone) subunit SoeA